MSRPTNAKLVATGGVFAALALVVMCLGGLIPVATFVCPMVCCLIVKVVMGACGKRTAWTCYAAVAILSVLLAPDKEAAGIFLFLGYYPMVKPRLDSVKLGFLWKLVLFNASIALAYFLMLKLLGMGELAEEYAGMGIFLTAVMVVLGNVTFFLLDRLLELRFQR